jgi:8-oxo-dGTP diphosphatase
MAAMIRSMEQDGRLHGVVAGIRREDGRWLMIRRAADVRRAPLKVAFPGGSVEAGESLEQALVREMREELGIVVRPIELCWRWDSPAEPLTIWGWRAEIEEGEIKANAREVDQILWLTSAEAIERADGLATNREFLACLERS